MRHIIMSGVCVCVCASNIILLMLCCLTFITCSLFTFLSTTAAATVRSAIRRLREMAEQ